MFGLSQKCRPFHNLPHFCLNLDLQNIYHLEISPPPLGGLRLPLVSPQGIPVNMTAMASLLQRGGYRTHLVGKWDVGMASAAHHPRARGYDSWLGYWHHTNDRGQKGGNGACG